MSRNAAAAPTAGGALVPNERLAPGGRALSRPARPGALLLVAALLGGCDGCAGPANQTGVGAPSEEPASSSAPAIDPSPTASLPAPPRPAAPRELTWKYPSSAAGPMQVVVSVPARADEQAKLPVLIALHGRGEAFKGAARGARGWIDDYGLHTAVRRLGDPPLTGEDLQGFASQDRLVKLNTSLAAHPYRGIIVVCPYTPDILAGDRPFSAAKPFARFVVDELLPRVYRETPAIGTAESTGIDGVSLGGRAALLVALARPRAFGAVGTLQPAFDRADANELARRAVEARKANPKLEIRLLTSDRDFFLEPTRAISDAFRGSGVAHRFLLVRGPHDYEFNRGPAVYEMLVFHDRVLRGEPAP